MELLLAPIKCQSPLHGRLAPTPSGYLHRGNAINFVLTWLFVRASGGTLRLRIDDLDAQRSEPAYFEDVFESLQWLGLDWDLGPKNAQEHKEQYSQLLRRDRYREMLQKLRERGLLFVCSCSRRQIREQSSDGQYQGTCRELNIPFEQANVSWRIRTPEQQPLRLVDVWRGAQTIDLQQCMRDFVVRRRDGLAAYQIASLCDDLDFGINFLLRGEDLLESSAAQRFLAESLQATAFLESCFCHHALLLDGEGNKLSKSAGSTSLRAEYEAGKSSEQFYEQLAAQLRIAQPGKEAVALSFNSADTLLQAYQRIM